MIALKEFVERGEEARDEPLFIYCLHFRGSPSADKGTLYSPASFPPGYRKTGRRIPSNEFVGLVSQTIVDFDCVLQCSDFHGKVRDEIQTYQDNNGSILGPLSISGDREYEITGHETLALER